MEVLEFIYSEDYEKEYYIVKAKSIEIEESIDIPYSYDIEGIVNIPSTYRGLPVSVIDSFYNCNKLTSITIPNSITLICSGAFAECSSLLSFNVIPSNENYSSFDGVLYSKDFTALIRYPEGKQDSSFVIPDDCLSINDDAFFNCLFLKSIIISGNVSTIGDRAFSFCSSLESVTIGNSLVSIEDCAFEGCSSLKSITIGTGLISIGARAFSFCSSLTSITFEGTIENWNIISKGDLWNEFIQTDVIHCIDGDVKESQLDYLPKQFTNRKL